MAKRIFALVLVLAMLVSLMPQVTVGVSAEGTKAPGASQWADHTNHDGWTEWGDDESEWTTLPTEQGKYFLSHDVSLQKQATVAKNIHLCLNDHTITQTKADTRHIYLEEGKGITLSIYDCGTKGKITGGTGGTGTVINVSRTNTFSLYGGTITGNNKATDAVIYVQAAKSTYPVGGVFNMYGGEISGNQVSNGVVYNAGGDKDFTNAQVNIYGGTIKDNVVTGSGGALYGKTYGTIHVENATITGNKAKNASAIYVQNHIELTIKNSTITGNTGTSASAEGYGAALYICGASAKVTLSGNVTIKDNTVPNAAIADLYINSSDGYDIEKLYVNELTGGDVRFGVHDKTVTEASDVVFLNGTQTGLWHSGWLTYVDATGAAKSITYGQKEGTDRFFFVEGHYHGAQKYVEWDKTASLPKADDNGVGYYLKDDVTVSTTANKARVTTGTLHLCLNGKTVSQAMTDVTPSNSESSDIFRVDGGALYLSDCTTVYDENGYFVSGGKITGGVKKGNGAALYINKAASVVEVTGIEFSGNINTQTNEGYGGAGVMVRYNTTPAKFIGCKFDNNQCKNISTGALVGGAGALALRDSGNAVVEKCLFTNNRAKYGAAFYCTGSTLTVKDSKITGNSGDNAPAINIGGTSTVTLENCTITGNSNTSDAGYGAVNLSNGASNVYLVGKTVIYDNLNKDGKQQNLHLQDYANLDYDVSGLTAGSKVGISFLSSRLQSGDKFFSTVGMTSNPGYCVSDHEDYEVAFNAETTRLELVEKSSTPPTPSVTHTHKLCNDAACSDHGADVAFQAWGDDAGEVGLPTSGNWYLTQNVTVSAATAISAELTLCLNGKTISQTANARIFTINEGGQLTITDCAEAYTSNVYTGGLITGGRHNTGSAVYVSSGTTFNMYSGRIGDCGPATTSSEQTGAAVFLHSASSGGATFNMYGGEITDCGGAKNWGGAISNGGGNAGKTVYVNIYGGKIFGNTAKNGAAIRLQTAGVATIYGGEIYGNNATDTGGAVYLHKSGAQLVLEGGNIHDNTAAAGGGAIFVSSTAGSVTLSKAPIVKDNKVGAEQNNLYLAGDTKVTVSNLQTGALIGLSRAENRATDVVSTNTVDAALMNCFTNDNAEDYVLEQKDGYVTLSKKPVVTEHMHNLCNDTACADHATVPFVKWEETDSLPSSGNYYLANDVTVTKVTAVDGALNLCLNGHTITQTAENRIFSINTDKSLSITDCGTTGTITGGKNDFGSVVYVNEGATFNLFGGKLTGNGPKTTTAAATGATVFLRSAAKGGATFNMYGGEITGNGGEKSWGGAVSNASGNAGKPVYVNIYGGKIYGNTAMNGGAIRMENSSVTTIYGGEIYDNTATSSGGAVYITKNAELVLKGGKITGNTSDLGAGIYVNSTGKVSISGDPIVTDNLEQDKKSNLTLVDDVTITLGEVKEAARIGITAAKIGRAFTTQTDADYTKNFASDSAYKTISYKEKALWIEGSTDHQHCVCAGAASGCDHTKQVWTAWESNTTLPTSGTYYLTSDVKLSAGYYDDYKITGELNLCLNGKTVTAYEGKRIVMTAKGGTLNLTDCTGNGMLTGGTAAWGAAVNINAGSTFNMYGGKITGNKCVATSGGIGAVYVQGAGATFNMYGGEISGNEGAVGTIHAPSKIDKEMFINIYGGVIENNKSVKVKDSAGKTVSNSGSGAAIYANGNTVINISGGAIRNNIAEANGGGIFTTGKGTVITMTGGEISGNQATNGGGLITQTNSKFILKDGLISGNKTTDNGAGMYISTNTEFVMEGGVITGNQAANGAGFYALRSKVELNGGEIVANEASNRSGAFGFSGATVEINKITVKSNTAKEAAVSYINRASSGSGENIKYYPSVVNINEGALITGNKATADCGAILVANADVVLTMNGGEISKNAGKNAGAIMTWKGSTFIMKGGKITGNTATSSGGAMYISTGSTFKMEGGTVSNNTALNAGAMYMLRSEGEFLGGTVTGNYAKQKITWKDGKETKSGGTAGAVYMSGADCVIRGTSFTYNKADNNGGAIVMGRYSYTENKVKKYDNTSLNIYGGYFAGNSTEKNAGVLLIQSKDTVVNMYGGTMTNNKAKSDAGAIYVSTDTQFNMTGGTITGNHAESRGGAFFCYRSTANITGGSIHSNTATSSAGMLTASGAAAKVTIKNLKIYGNEAKTAGALASQGKATLNVENCEIYDNQSTSGHGGAVFVSNYYSNGNFTNCKFFENTAAGQGGAVLVSTMGNATFKNCEFTDNKAAKTGGALATVQGSQNILESCVFTKNTADEKGGAIFNRGNLTMTDSLIENNTAKLEGGGIATDTNSTTGSGIMKGMEIRNSQIKNNTAGAQGGGIYLGRGCRAELYNTQITGNKAAMEGGAIWAIEDLELHDTEITGNTSGGEGYAVYMNDAEYDGHSYFASRNKMSGNVIVKDNEGGDLYMGKDVVITITADGLGDKTHIEVALDSGVLTNRLFGAYHYEGGAQVYTVTYGDRSVTDPEYDASLVPGADAEEEKEGAGDVILYAGIGVFVIAIAAVAAVLIAKKKKAGKAAEEATKE